MTHVYIYRLKTDSGLAPCVENGLLSLAICKGGQVRNGKPVKTGLRWWIGKQIDVEKSEDDFYVIGIYKGRLLYVAKITEVVTMESYYSGISSGRLDDIYICKDGEKRRNNKLKGSHDDEKSIIRDWAGVYVLLSREYVYLGKDTAEVPLMLSFMPKYRETKCYESEEAKRIVDICFRFRDGKEHKPNDYIEKCGDCGGKKVRKTISSNTSC